MGNFIDLTGQRFGRLTVIKRAENDKWGNVRWLCQCDCGNTVTRHGFNLRGSRSKDCGCGRHERCLHTLRHGGRNTRLYSIWVDMIRRCKNQNRSNYKYYGSRGITVCPEWTDFSNFQKWAENHGYAENLTIDRIDNDSGYSPVNCRWVSIKVQENNRGNNTRISFNGENHTLAEWSEITGIHRATISRRILKYGWSVERALTQQVRKSSAIKTKNKPNPRG